MNFLYRGYSDCDMIIIREIGNWYALEFFFIVVVEQYIPSKIIDYA